MTDAVQPASSDRAHYGDNSRAAIRTSLYSPPRFVDNGQLSSAGEPQKLIS